MRFCDIAAAVGFLASALPASAVEVMGPDGRVVFELTSGGGHLTCAIRMAGRPVIEPSPLGILVDGVDLARGAELGSVEAYRGDETYPTRGVHSRAVNRYRGARVAARGPGFVVAFAIDVRAFDDGVGFLVPGDGRLMLDFHGANKPTGEPRTWPNELGREGVYGLEHRGMAAWARHDATLPFTRLLAGHADYTPTIFGERRKETSWPHQIADAVVMTGPLLVYGGHPRGLLENPAVGMIKSVPSVWDETIVLPPSEIGEVAVFARRRDDRWFLAVVNGPEPRSLRIPATFLGTGTYRASLVRDRPDDPAAVALETATISRDDVLTIDLRTGGGFVARFDRP